MYSDNRNGCSHPLGFPIRTSPDHSLLAASRGLSQLTTSFIAYLRQGIHTHALSSLTIKSTSHTWRSGYALARILLATRTPTGPKSTGGLDLPTDERYFLCAYYLCCQQPAVTLPNNGKAKGPVIDVNARQIFNCQRSRLRQQSVEQPSSTDC